MFFFLNFQSYKFFGNLLLTTFITSTVMANILQICGKRRLNTSKNVFNTILERMMHTYRAIPLFFFIIKRIFRYIFTGLVKPLQTLGASRCSPKKRIGYNCDIVLHEHIFDQVALILI